MGIIQGRTEEPAQKTTVELDLCWLCLSRDHRERQSVCTCNHCSYPLCTDCMNNHTNELPQNVAQLSVQLHDLEQLFQIKQNMVEQEISMANEEIKHYFKTYQNDLLEAHQAIINDIGNERQNAEKYLNKIHSELQTITGDIKTLAGESIFQPKRMEALLNQLNDIQKKLETYDVTKNTELEIVMPKYTLKFECILTSTNGTSAAPPSESSNLQDNVRNKSGHQRKFHPYKKGPNKVSSKNMSSYDNETDSNQTV